MNPQIYILKRGQSKFCATVAENETTVQILCKLDGPPFQREAIIDWLKPILGLFENDPRPVLMKNGNTGEQAMVIESMG